MQNTEKKSMTLGGILSILSLIFGVIISIFYTPFVLKNLGDTEYGIRSFSASLVQYLSYLSLGLSAAYVRFLAIKRKESGVDGEKHLNGLFLVVYILIGFLALLIGLAICSFLNFGVIPLSKYTSSEKILIVTNLFIMVINCSITFFFAVFGMFITAEKKFVFKTILSFASDCIVPLATIPFIALGGRSIVMSIVTLAGNVCLSIIKVIYCCCFLKMKATFKLSKSDLGTFKEIFKFSIFVFVVTLIVGINNQVDKTILGFAVGAVAVTIYQLSNIIPLYLANITDNIIGLFIPRITENSVNEKKEEVQKSFDLMSKIVFFLSTLLVGGFFACGRFFINAWLGEGRENVFYFASLLMLAELMPCFGKMNLQCQRGMGKHKQSAIIYFVSFIVNVALSLSLVFVVGIMGCIIGTIVAYFLETLFLSIYSHKKLELNQKTAIRSMALNLILNGVVSVSVFLLFYRVISLDGFNPWVSTVISGLIFLIIELILQLFFNNSFVMSALSYFNFSKRFDLFFFRFKQALLKHKIAKNILLGIIVFSIPTISLIYLTTTNNGYLGTFVYYSNDGKCLSKITLNVFNKMKYFEYDIETYELKNEYSGTWHSKTGLYDDEFKISYYIEFNNTGIQFAAVDYTLVEKPFNHYYNCYRTFIK